MDENPRSFVLGRKKELTIHGYCFLLTSIRFCFDKVIKKIITAERDVTVVGECKNASEVLDFFRQQTCDVVVLDIEMPGKSGLDLLLDLNKLVPM